MARPTQSDSESASGNIQTIQIDDNADRIALDHIDPRDADFKKDGADLIIERSNGETIIVEGYFDQFSPPTLMGAEGQSFNPDLVQSFLLPQYPGQYAGPLSQGEPVGAVQELSGEAKITRTDGTVEILEIGSPIFQGDIVETDAEGALNIIFLDESSFAVSEDARLAIDEYVFDPETQGGTQNFSVLKGMFVYTSGLIGRDDPDDVNIDTPVGSIGIRGTTIAGNVNTGEITVLDGAIVLRTFDGVEMTLSGQFETARFNVDNGSIDNMGMMDPAQMGVKFAGIAQVVPTVFSSVNDASGTSGEAQGESANDPAGANNQNDAQGEGENFGDNPVEGNAEQPQGEGEFSGDGPVMPGPDNGADNNDVQGGNDPVQGGEEGIDPTLPDTGNDGDVPEPQGANEETRGPENLGGADGNSESGDLLPTENSQAAQGDNANAPIEPNAVNPTNVGLDGNNTGLGTDSSGLNSNGNNPAVGAQNSAPNQAGQSPAGNAGTGPQTTNQSNPQGETTSNGNDAQNSTAGNNNPLPPPPDVINGAGAGDGGTNPPPPTPPATNQAPTGSNNTFTYTTEIGTALPLSYLSQQTLQTGTFFTDPESDPLTFSISDVLANGASIGNPAWITMTSPTAGSVDFNVPDNLGLAIDTVYSVVVAADDGNGNISTAEFSFEILAPEVLGTPTNDNPLDGVNANDLVVGLAGDDTITASGAQVTVFTGLGADNITASGFQTVIFGNEGVDTITVTGNEANVFAGLDDDVISIQSSDNTILGQDGNDTFTVADTFTNNDIRGGVGIDTINYSAYATPITVTLDGVNPVTVTGTGDTISGIENIAGGIGSDSITGDNNVNFISGGGGADNLSGGGGADTLNGDAGNDRFITVNNDGNDTYDGGLGFDTYDATGSNLNRQYDASAGTVFASSITETDTITGIEEFSAGGGDDIFVIANGDGNQTYRGNAGDDIYNASAATNNINIDLGSNSITVGGDTDIIFDIETFILGSGTNTVNASGTGTDYTYNGSIGGIDTYDASSTGGVNTWTFLSTGLDVSFAVKTDTLIDFETLTDALGNNSTLDFSSSLGAVDIDLSSSTITDDGFGNTYSVSGIANVTGSGQADTLRGDLNANTISGGLGDDIIIGSGGADLLDGGSGYDILDYSFAGGSVIADLTSGNVSNDGTGTSDTITGIEEIRGSNLGDIITAADGFVINTGMGGDQITLNASPSGNLDIDAGDAADVILVDTNIFDISSDGNNIHIQGGNDAAIDRMEFTNISAGTFDIDADGVEDIIEEIEVFDFDVNAVADTINFTLQDFMIDNNNSQLLTIEINDYDILNLDFDSADYSVIGGDGNLLAGDMFLELFNSGTGNTVRIEYTLNASATGSINITGLSGASGDLNLNLLADGINLNQGFAIENPGIGAQQFGYSISALGDIDDDGLDDFIIGEGDDFGGAGESFIYWGDATSGFIPDSNIVSAFTGNVTELQVVGIGDFNGDGFEDYMVSAPFENGNAGQIEIRSGLDDSIIVELNGMTSGDLTGQSIAGIGDVNADGYADVLIGAPGSDIASADSGAAYVLYGRNYSPTTVIDVNNIGVGELDFIGTGNNLTDVLFNNSSQVYIASDVGVRRFNVAADGTLAIAGQVDSGDLNTASGSAIANGLNNVTAISSPNPSASEIVAVDGTAGVVTIFDSSFTIVGYLQNAAFIGAQDIVVNTAGDRAYVLTSSNNIAVVNIDTATLTSSTYVGNVNATLPTNLENIAVRGNDLYVTANDGGTQLVRLDLGASLNDPPLDTSFDGDGVLNLGPNGVNDIVIDGPNNRAFVSVDLGSPTDGNSRIYAVDLASGTVITQIDHNDITDLGDIVSLSYLDDRLYVGTRDSIGPSGTLWTFDVTDTTIALTQPPRPISRYEDASFSNLGLVSVADNGPHGIPLVIRNNGQVLSIDNRDDGIVIEGLGANDSLATNVAAAGNINNDEFNDYLIAEPGNAGGANVGRVHLVFGDPSNPVQLGSNTFTIYNIDVDGGRIAIETFYMGDVNGFGESDFAIVEDDGTSATLHIFYGENITGSATVSVDSSDVKITEAAGHRIIAGGFAGDFNGDGFDDFVVGVDTDPGNTSTSKVIDFYLVYGNGLTDLQTDGFNASNSYHMTYTLDAPFAGNYSFEVASVGDVNGDGYYDIAIGTTAVDNDDLSDDNGSTFNNDDEDGTVFFVYGFDNSGTHVSLSASTNNQSVFGDDAANTISDNNWNNTTFLAGGGNDTINIQNNAFNSIDGGAGYDILAFFGGATLDLTGFNTEDISRIEEIDVSGVTTTLVLEYNDIFQLLDSSDDGTLSIRASGSSVLRLETGSADADVDINEFAALFHADHTGNDGTFEVFDLGGAELKIDGLLFSNNNVETIV